MSMLLLGEATVVLKGINRIPAAGSCWDDGEDEEQAEKQKAHWS